MVGSMVSFWWDGLEQANAETLEWEEMEGSWNFEVGYGVSKVDM